MNQGKVIKVVDGDTLRVKYGAITIKIRIASIDCPELNTIFGKKIKKYLADMIENEEVEFKIIKVDNFNRFLSEVYYKGEELGEHLVAKGYAWHWEKYSYNPNLIQIEREAQEQKLGLWSEEWKQEHYKIKHPQSKEYLNL